MFWSNKSFDLFIVRFGVYKFVLIVGNLRFVLVGEIKDDNVGNPALVKNAAGVKLGKSVLVVDGGIIYDKLGVLKFKPMTYGCYS